MTKTSTLTGHQFSCSEKRPSAFADWKQKILARQSTVAPQISKVATEYDNDNCDPENWERVQKQHQVLVDEIDALEDKFIDFLEKDHVGIYNEVKSVLGGLQTGITYNTPFDSLVAEYGEGVACALLLRAINSELSMCITNLESADDIIHADDLIEGEEQAAEEELYRNSFPFVSFR